METNRRVLILSPEAGFGNRVRAIAAGIILAKKTKREFEHYWIGSNNSNSDYAHVADSQRLGWTDYFEDNLKLCERENVDLILTEWLPGEPWYHAQNRACLKYPDAPKIKATRNLDLLLSLYSDVDVVLLETSLDVCTSLSENFEQEMMIVYQQYFRPLPRFKRMLDFVPEMPIGVSIRRGEFLLYFPEARQSLEEIVKWLGEMKEDATIALFGDEKPFLALIKEKLDISTYNLPILENWESGYLQFLILAFKCKRIYGTPMSSFAEQAGLFSGRNHYKKVLQ